MPNLSLVGDETSFVVQYISQRTKESTETVFKKIKKGGYRFEQDKIGLNIISANNFSINSQTNSILLFLSVFPDTFKKVKKYVIGTNHDIILCIPESFFDEEFKQMIQDLNICLLDLL